MEELEMEMDLEQELELALQELEPSEELPVETFYIAMKSALKRLDECEFEVTQGF
ncbi:MAG: hypothetical protein O3A63_11765 [Proteobacteria bacterium]|nr:hypothetical protein [Pseudomonadota bacterium]